MPLHPPAGGVGIRAYIKGMLRMHPRTVTELNKEKTPGSLRSALQFIAGFFVLALIMLGVGGTIYKLIAPGGWLAQLIGGSLGYLGAAILALVGVALFAWIAQDRITPTRRDKFGDWWVYLCAGVGLIYVVQIAWLGSL